MATMFTPYGTADEKEQARMFVASHFKGGKVLSMSSSTFGFEETLLRMHPEIVKIDCYEYDKEVFKAGQPVFQLIKERFDKIRFVRDNIFNAKATKYDFMFLDFCGPITPVSLTRLVAFLQGFKGTCFITVLKGREQLSPDVLKIFKAVDAKDYRERVFPQVIAQYTNLEESIPRYEYHNGSVNTHSVYMQLYGFQTKKELTN